jgi:hypothetical protein
MEADIPSVEANENETPKKPAMSPNLRRRRWLLGTAAATTLIALAICGMYYNHQVQQGYASWPWTPHHVCETFRMLDATEEDFRQAVANGADPFCARSQMGDDLPER